jgi:hypothetical protein
MRKGCDMKNRHLKTTLIGALALLLILPYGSMAQSFLPNSFGALLTGYEEVPPVFTSGSGIVQVRISGNSINYSLSYSNLSSGVTQAHIHFAERPVNGGIIVFLCDNTGRAPRGTPACPNSGTVTGTVTAADVNPPNNPEPVTKQGIGTGDIAGLVTAIQHQDAYVNVHTANFPAGEIRGWLR